MFVQLFALFYLWLNTAYGKEVSLKLTHFDSTKYPLAVCNDGSKGGFYFKKSDSSSPYWLVHLQGGGWCYDIPSCQKRNVSRTDLTTNSSWKPTIPKTGIFDDNSKLNPLYNANKIFVPYCTSDAYMGFQQPSPTNNNWYFMGQKIVEAVILTLITNPSYNLGSTPNTDILVLSGCSAGGRGAMVNLDYIPAIIKPTGRKLKSLFGILDSALYVDVPPLTLAPNHISVREQTKAVFKYQNCTGRVDGSRCGNHYTNKNDKWKCLFGEYKMPLLKEDYIISASQYDSYQLKINEGGTNPTDYSNQQKQYAKDPFGSRIRDVVLNKINSNVLSTTCDLHCTSEEKEYWNVKTGGVSFSDMIRNYMNGNNKNANKWIGNCTNGVNCGQGCNHRVECKSSTTADNIHCWSDCKSKGDDEIYAVCTQTYKRPATPRRTDQQCGNNKERVLCAPQIPTCHKMPNAKKCLSEVTSEKKKNICKKKYNRQVEQNKYKWKKAVSASNILKEHKGYRFLCGKIQAKENINYNNYISNPSSSSYNMYFIIMAILLMIGILCTICGLCTGVACFVGAYYYYGQQSLNKTRQMDEQNP